jgi:glycosyltransferase involved in cell wall biosynthesis
MTDLSIALCGIVRNEIRGIIEWLAHNKVLGFTDFVIYDNESTDGTSEVLQALDEAGELIRIEWPHAVGVNPQIMAYDHMRKSSTVDWIAFFDADEFLFLRHDDSISDFLKRFGDDVGAIAVNWVPFNSNGQDRFRPAPVIERFTESLLPSARYSHSIKCIGRRVAISGNHIHSVSLRRGRYVTSSGEDVVFLSRTKSKTPDVAVAALHHYMVKSLEEFEEKRMRGHANSHYPDKKRAKLDLRLQTANAPGLPNTDLLAWSGRMRTEAMRLRGILLDAGLSYPVWPFIEAE